MKHTLTILFFFLPFLMFAQANSQHSNDSIKPFVLGVIDQVESKILGENRVLNIYLPEGYNPNDTAKYPVIYLLDGSADEDFIHVVGLVQFNTFEWIKQLPKSIVVGIANIDRRRDFTFPSQSKTDSLKNPTSGHSDQFIQFIEKELQPFINKKYKTNSSKTLIGQSLGGLLATEILFKKPYLFNKYIIVSPSLWWNNGSLLNATPSILSDTFKQATDIYIAVGKEGKTPSVPTRVMEDDAKSLADKIKRTKSQNIRVYFDYLPKENHATILHLAVSNSFKFLFPKGKK